MTSIEPLINKILSNAEIQADDIVDKAEKSTKSKLIQHEKRLERMLMEGERRAGKSGFEIREKKKQFTRMYSNKIKLRNREIFIEKIISDAVLRIDQMISSTNYPEILVDLILEAVVGLNHEKVVLNCSKEEKVAISSPLLSRIAYRAEEITGQDISITLSREPSSKSRGVVLTTSDGRVSYNNQISARLIRKKRKLEIIIRESIDKLELEDE